MGEWQNWSQGGVNVRAWGVEPHGTPRGKVIVIQEIFGLTDYICSVVDRLGDAGFSALAPALFDHSGRTEPISYDDPQAGLAQVGASDPAVIAATLDACLDRLGDKTSVIGFCWGGGLAWDLAARKNVSFTSCFYPTRLTNYLPAAPAGRVQLHIAANDKHTPDAVIDAAQTAKPDLEVFHYEGPHGFHCDARQSHHEASAKIAWDRTLDGLSKA